MTDSDGLYYAPDIAFTLDGFQNPREQGYTSPWKVTIYNDWEKELYYWQSETGPTIYVSGVSAPSYMKVIYENQQNGAFSWIEFLVTTTGGLTQGDKIVIQLPYGWQFSTESEVYGRSNNLANYMTPAVSVDQRQLEFNVEMSFALQRRRLEQGEDEDDDVDEDELFLRDGRRGMQAQIDSGSSFQFRVTEMKNFNSFRPSDESIQYYVYSADGILYEELRDGNTM